jgi:tripartite-type tricarboxylate transporter receptor subunit TctC
MVRKPGFAIALAVAFACGLAPVAAQQAYPSKPVRLIVPWPSGTPADVNGRVFAEQLTAGLGQPVVVENRPGAAGTVGMTEALRQQADGYTVYVLTSPTLVAPILFPNLQLDVRRDLEPVGMMAWSYNVLVTPLSTPATSGKELLALIRAKPGELSFASGGNGTPAHLAGELFRQQTGTKSVHVPYNVFAQAIGDLISGRTQFMFLTAVVALPQISAGKLRPLAVTGAHAAPGGRAAEPGTAEGGEAARGAQPPRRARARARGDVAAGLRRGRRRRVGEVAGYRARGQHQSRLKARGAPCSPPTSSSSVRDRPAARSPPG